MPERSITEEAANRLVETLRECSPEEFYVTWRKRDVEAERLGEALDATLRRAGWTTDHPLAGEAPVVAKNRVEVEGDDEDRPAVRRLLDWLGGEGFNPDFLLDPDKKDLAIHVEPLV